MTIRAKLKPPRLDHQFAIDQYRALVNQGRRDAAQCLQRARKRAVSYARLARQRERERGYQEGLRETRLRFAAILDEATARYDDALEAAQDSVTSIAMEAAAAILGDIVRERPEPYREWLREALTILKGSQRLTLHYAPEFDAVLSSLSREYAGSISFSADPSLGVGEIKLIGSSGVVEFAWREALDRLKRTNGGTLGSRSPLSNASNSEVGNAHRTT